MTATTLVRLQKYLSEAGVAARRKAEELIVAGRVSVNGKIVKILGSKVDPDSDHVSVDGQAVTTEDKFYLLFNKPKGCITAVRDDRGRPTVMDYLPNLPVSVAPVGRLDFYSEGVLLLTNDGELAARLLAPKSHVPKTYHVKIFGQIEPRQLVAMRDGVRLEDGTQTQPAEIDELPAESKHSWLAITLHEGKSRQIHRMCEAVGLTVQKIQRVAFANLTFHGLRIGDARELTQQEVNALREQVGLDRTVVARGRWKAKREDTDHARRASDKRRAEKEAAAPAPPAPLPAFADVPREPARRSTVASGPMAAFGEPRPTKISRGPAKLPAPQPPRSGGAGRVGSKPSPPRAPRAEPGSERRLRPGEDRSSRPGAGRPSRPGAGRPSRPGAGKPSRPGAGKPSRPGAERSSRPGKPARGPSRSKPQGRR